MDYAGEYYMGLVELKDVAMEYQVDLIIQRRSKLLFIQMEN